MTGRDRVGDLLLCFGALPAAVPTRSGSGRWQALATCGGATLHADAVSPGFWNGAPWSGQTLADGTRLWLLGELYGDDAGTIDGHSGNGHFLAISWDPRERRWHLRTDRFGTFHVYHADAGPRSAFGTFHPAVATAAGRRRLDPLGLAGFLALGFFPRDRTHFDDVRILRPAHQYVLDDSGRLLASERYWDWSQRPDPRRTRDDTLQELDAVLRAVLADQTSEGRIAIPISGGLDSRTTVAVLTRPEQDADARFWAYSYGYGADSVETRIARSVASARRLRFEAFVIPEYLFEQLPRVLACVEGFQDVAQCRQAAVAAALVENADFVIAAHWGDVWLDDAGLVERREASLDELTRHALGKVLKKGRGWLLQHVARDLLQMDDPEALVTDMVREELKRLGPVGEPDFLLKALKTELWSFRWTCASLRMFQAAAFPRLPFYDTRFADFIATVPSAWLAGRRLQVEYLKRFAPDLARITWQAGDADLYWATRHPLWRLPKRVLARLRRSFATEQLIEANWEVQLLSPAGRDGLEHWLLRPGLRLHDLLAPARIRELLDDFRAQPRAPGHSYTVSMLLTLSGWLEFYG